MGSDKGILREYFPIINSFLKEELISHDDFTKLITSNKITEIKEIFVQSFSLSTYKKMQLYFYIHEVVPAKANKTNWERWYLTNRMNFLFRLILINGGVFSLKKLSVLGFLHEKYLSNAICDLEEMEVFQKIKLSNYEVIFTLNPKFFKEATNEIE